MTLAEFGSGQVFLSILWIFLFVIWFWLLITIFTDLWRTHMSGWAKAAWVIFVIIFPFLGILVYLIANGKGMQERALEAQKQAEAQMRQYVQEVAGPDSGGGNVADELEKLSNLKEKGVISQEDFDKQKAKLLA